MNLTPKTLALVAGARPNFMKIAPLVRAIAGEPRCRALIVHTGQHYDTGMSDIFFDELGIRKPDAHLGVGSLPREQQIEAAQHKFREWITQQKVDSIVVVGDVNSTVACARVGKELGIPVAHVEAGLRSFDPSMPEEHNRIETDRLSDFLYVTEEAGMKNIANEKLTGKSFLVGNVMIDSLIHHLPQAQSSGKREELGLFRKQYLVSTFHRPSNVDTRESLLNVIETIESITSIYPLVLPLHPRTKSSLERFDLLARFASIPALHVTPPLGYFDFIGLVYGSVGVVTDSGGIQEETTYLQIPCLTMRENTERPVTVSLGSSILVGMDRKLLLDCLRKIKAGSFKQGSVPPLWDGHAAERILKSLLNELA